MAPVPLRALRRWPISILTVVLVGLWLPKAPVIERPRMGVPAVLRPGDSFEVEVRGSWWPLVRPTYELRRGDQSFGLAGPARGLWFETRAELTLPLDLAPGGYDLVATGWFGSDVRPRAVHLLRPERALQNLRAVHLADLPILVEEPGPADWAQIVHEINLWDPDVVLADGDLAYSGRALAWERLEQGLLELEAPVIAALGNHEREGLKGYLDRFGPPWQRTDVGAYTVLTLDTSHGRDQLTDTQLEWLEAELRDTAGRPTLVQLHHPFYGVTPIQRGRARFLRAIQGAGVRLVLSGHVHFDDGFDGAGLPLPLEVDGELPEGTLFLCTTSAGRHVRGGGPFASWPGYRVLEFDGDQPTWVGYDEDLDGRQEPARSVPWGRIDFGEPGSPPVSRLALPLGVPVGRLAESVADRRLGGGR